MAEVKVHVYRDSEGEFRVYPPVVVLHLATDDRMILKNHTGEDLLWDVPAGPFAASHRQDIAGGDDGGGDATQAQTPAAVSYLVYMVGSRRNAKGNSDPILIVE